MATISDSEEENQCAVIFETICDKSTKLGTRSISKTDDI